MAKDIKNALSRSSDTILSDVLGAVALVVMLYGGLCLPNLI